MLTRSVPLSPAATEYRKKRLRQALEDLSTPALVIFVIRLQTAVYLRRVRLAMGV